jgi:nucleoside-triphosphatase
MGRRVTPRAEPIRMHAILLTGRPGIGKTTAVRRAADALSGWRIRGFTTGEIRSAGYRLGFQLETFDGRSVVLARVDLKSPHRVGRYGVDLGALEAIAESALSIAKGADVYVLDEIGKMECLSPRFATAVTAILDSDRPVIATVALHGGGLIEQVKRRTDVELWQVRRDNRDELPDRIVGWLMAWNRDR